MADVAAAGGRGKNSDKKKTKSSKAKVIFPVTRLNRKLKEFGMVSRVGETAGVYLAAVFDYLCTDLLDMAVNRVKDENKKRITPRTLMYCIRNDEEFNKLLKDITLSDSGTIEYIHSVLQVQKENGKRVITPAQRKQINAKAKARRNKKKK